jgi:ribonuclease HI
MQERIYDMGLEIIGGMRNFISVTGYMNWPKRIAGLAYFVTDGEKIIGQNVLVCKGIESIFHLELSGIVDALNYATANLVIIKVTQNPLINGINSDLDFWAENDWMTKKGSPLKHMQFWQALYNEKERRQLIALQLEEPVARNLQLASKALIAGYSSN